MFLSQRVHVLSLLQHKFGLVFFRLFDGALETSNFRFEEARSAITLLRCFLQESTQRERIARVKFAEELGSMSKNRLRWITLVRGPIWRIHSLTLMISWALGILKDISLRKFSDKHVITAAVVRITIKFS